MFLQININYYFAHKLLSSDGGTKLLFVPFFIAFTLYRYLLCHFALRHLKKKRIQDIQSQNYIIWHIKKNNCYFTVNKKRSGAKGWCSLSGLPLKDWNLTISAQHCLTQWGWGKIQLEIAHGFFTYNSNVKGQGMLLPWGWRRTFKLALIFFWRFFS